MFLASKAHCILKNIPCRNFSQLYNRIPVTNLPTNPLHKLAEANKYSLAAEQPQRQRFLFSATIRRYSNEHDLDRQQSNVFVRTFQKCRVWLSQHFVFGNHRLEDIYSFAILAIFSILLVLILYLELLDDSYDSNKLNADKEK